MRDILIVEDGAQEQQRLLQLANAARFSADAVSSVEEAKTEIRKHRYRLVILDLGLEDQSGLHLFRDLSALPYPPKVLVLTGNPSTHLKQRFLDEGAVAYVYKGSQSASNESLTEMLQSLLAGEELDSIEYHTIALTEFLRDYVTPASRELFHQQGNTVPHCACGSTHYVVSFSHKTQLPPIVEGQVCCSVCGKPLDVELS